MKTLFLFANPTNIFLYSKTFDFTRFCGPPAGLWQLPQVYHPTSRGKDGEELWWHRRCAGIPAVECGWCENVAKRGALVLWSLHEKKGGPSVLELFFFGVVLLLMYMYIHVYIYICSLQHKCILYKCKYIPSIFRGLLNEEGCLVEFQNAPNKKNTPGACFERSGSVQLLGGSSHLVSG